MSLPFGYNWVDLSNNIIAEQKAKRRLQEYEMLKRHKEEKKKLHDTAAYIMSGVWDDVAWSEAIDIDLVLNTLDYIWKLCHETGANHAYEQGYFYADEGKTTSEQYEQELYRLNWEKSKDFNNKFCTEYIRFPKQQAINKLKDFVEIAYIYSWQYNINNGTFDVIATQRRINKEGEERRSAQEYEDYYSPEALRRQEEEEECRRKEEEEECRRKEEEVVARDEFNLMIDIANYLADNRKL